MPFLGGTGTYIEGKQVFLSYIAWGIVFAVEGQIVRLVPVEELTEACSDYQARGQPVSVIKMLGATGRFSMEGERRVADFVQTTLEVLGATVVVPEWN